VKLPYRAETATGAVLDFEFPLHPETGSAIRVAQLTSAVLEALDREVKLSDDVANGDLLQALAFALAVRARMIHAPLQQTGQLTAQLLAQALEAAEQAEEKGGPAGHA